MSRDHLSAELQALINRGHCEWHSVMDATLVSGQPLHLARADMLVGLVQYLSDLAHVEPFASSVLATADLVEFAIQNVDTIIGKAVTGTTNLLSGARATLGVVFIDNDPLSPNYGEKYYDAKMSGEIVSTEVSLEEVECKLMDDLDSVIVSGRTVSSEFPWREPVATPYVDPDDLDIEEFRRRGRRGYIGPGGYYIGSELM